MLIHASPAFYLYDGYSAVYIFFVLSGLVLSRSIQPADSFLAYAGARALRLGLPSLAACAFSALMYTIFPGHNEVAGALLHSTWFVSLWHPVLSIASVLRDGILNALVLGYRESALSGPIGPPLRFLQPISSSFAPPLWTLSTEFIGSLFLFLLCALRTLPTVAKSIIWVILALILFRTPYICFLVGHLIAEFHFLERPPMPRFIAATLIALGVYLCVHSEFWHPDWLVSGCETVSCDTPYHLLKMAGGCCVFIGLICLEPVKSFLNHRVFVALGRLSFPLYLVHWPVLFGVCAWIFVETYSHIGGDAARFLVMVIGIAGSLWVATLFTHVDRLAVSISRNVRRWGFKRQPAELSAGKHRPPPQHYVPR